MSYETLKLIELIVLFAFAAIVITAIIKQSRGLRIAALFILVFNLVWRENMVQSVARALMTDSPLKDHMLDEYRTGLDLVLDYVERTSILLVVVSVILIVLFARSSLLRKNPRIKLIIALASIFALIVREISIPVYTYISLGASSLPEEIFAHHRDGALDALAYYYRTYYYVIPMYVLLIMLCIRRLGIINKAPTDIR